MRQPKENRKGDETTVALYDQCQTPFYAVDPLLPYIKAKGLIWESAAGEGQLVKKLRLEGFDVTDSDLDWKVSRNFLSWSPQHNWQIQVTNPPFSIKYKWLARSYALERPFALLMKVEALGAATAQRLFDRYGIEIILLDKRVNFKMPNLGYDGSGASFPVAWYTWGLGIGRELTYAKVKIYPDDQVIF